MKFKQKGGAVSYKVSTKSGRTYHASKIDHKAGFLEMHCWDGEHRVPAGEITYIKSTEVDELIEIVLPVFVFSFVFFLVIFVLT
ncbi:MAG: hypothetical protein CSB47_00870 [Proteobacteria bacterium]|nr:MAG: hypothetical protein CSB47_00870 [Pseudomonadota bacterium]